MHLCTQNEPPRPASLAPPQREIRLFGQVEWPYGRSDDRSGSGSLLQYCWAQATWSPRVTEGADPRAPAQLPLVPATNWSTKATTSSLFSVAHRNIDVLST